MKVDHEERLEIMTRPELQGNLKNPFQYGYIHLPFSDSGKQKVNELTHRLNRDGSVVLSRPRTTGGGYDESCVLDAENNQIEIAE